MGSGEKDPDGERFKTPEPKAKDYMSVGPSGTVCGEGWNSRNARPGDGTGDPNHPDFHPSKKARNSR